MTPDGLATSLSAAVALGALAVACLDIYRHRPSDMQRLFRPSGRFLAPAWFVTTAAAFAAIVLAPRGMLGRLLRDDWAGIPISLAMAQVFLLAGSPWVWRAGLRGKGFGWLEAWRGFRSARSWAIAGAGAALACAITLIPIHLLESAQVPVGMNPELARKLEAKAAAGAAYLAILWAQILIAPFAEEALFRHYLQTRLTLWMRRSGVWEGAGAIVASALWAMAHAGIMYPGWFKFLQIFAIGLCLGWAQRRRGVGMAIAIHSGFNLCVLIAGNWSGPPDVF